MNGQIIAMFQDSAKTPSHKDKLIKVMSGVMMSGNAPLRPDLELHHFHMF